MVCLRYLAVISSFFFHLAASSSSILQQRADDEYEDFSWVESFAAVGDSFTAGIGSGDLYSDREEDAQCSRYDWTYPVLMNKFFGQYVDKFTYTACSGAKTPDIFEQINNLSPEYNLLVMSAGGNDLCLSSIIGTCILASGRNGAEACQKTIDNAYTGLDTFFKDNIRELLVALNKKLAVDGVAVVVKYAQYFNTETEECAEESWSLVDFVRGGSLPLTVEWRKKFNELVRDTNKAIQSVVDEFDAGGSRAVVTADWDPWAPLIGGQFCEPGASPMPSDRGNDDLMFFKLNTAQQLGFINPQSKFASNESLEDFSSLDDSPAANIASLRKRDPQDPGCPSSSLELPDSIGKVFHPSELGHEVIAAYAIEAAKWAQASLTGDGNPSCPKPEGRTCYGDDKDYRGYASAEALDNNIEDFCSWVKKEKPDVLGWSMDWTYYEGTPDEYNFKVQLSDDAFDFDEKVCKESLGHIIHGCDTPSGDSNPMNWKRGGERTTGDYVYTVSIKRTNRPWPPPEEKIQFCEGWYKVLWQQYDMWGGGWAGWDHGESLKSQINPCCGSGSQTGWGFEYFDEPDKDGYEWHAWFKTAIGTRRRCFDNGNVQCDAGGPCGGHCKGNG